MVDSDRTRDLGKYPDVYNSDFQNWLVANNLMIRESPENLKHIEQKLYADSRRVIGTQLLDYLKERWGFYVHKTELAQTIYNHSDETEINCLKVNLCYMNKKLPQGVPLLRKPGVGYGLGISKLQVGGALNILLVASVFAGCKVGEPLTSQDLCLKLYEEDDAVTRGYMRQAIDYTNRVFLRGHEVPIVNVDGPRSGRARYGFQNFKLPKAA
jgi:hypothetical protein